MSMNPLLSIKKYFNKKRELREFRNASVKEVFTRIYITNKWGDAESVSGKGSNLHFAGPVVEAKLRERRIPLERVITSSLDVDTIVHPDYFAYLTHMYATVPIADPGLVSRSSASYS